MHAVAREQRPAARARPVVVCVAMVMPMVMAVVVMVGVVRGWLCMAVLVPVVPQLGLDRKSVV